jgi:FMN-dependent NADH-azoreductase
MIFGGDELKKLLYITVNSKPEAMSVSKKAGREFVDRFIMENNDFFVEELDLYNEDIPEVNHLIFTDRAELVSGQAYDDLMEEDKAAVNRVNQLCDQFISADVYVIAAPMWSVFFPSRLKRYIDCIAVNNKTILITEDEVTGLLDDKPRKMVYIQSSGGVYPHIITNKFDYGVNYLRDVFKSLGINRFEKILIEGTDSPKVGVDEAMSEAYKDIETTVKILS